MRLDRLPKPALSFLCQGLVSGTGFMASLAVMQQGQRNDYAAFVLIINAYMLLTSLLNALLLQPMATLSSRMAEQVVRRMLGLGVGGGLALGLLGSVLLLGYQAGFHSDAASSLPGPTIALCFCLLLYRDVQRAGWLLDGDLANLLRLDGAYFVLASVGLALAVIIGRFGLEGVLLAISLPALIGLRHRVHTAAPSGAPPFAVANRGFWLEVWHCARWALPGVLVTWLFSNGYWFYLASTQGHKAVAMLAASRLAFTPVGLMIQGWSSYYRPLFARLENAGALGEKADIIRRQNAMAMVLVLVYASLLCLAGGVAPRYLPTYLRGTVWLQYVWAWAGYFAVQWLRTVRMTARLANAAGFRLVFRSGVVGCLVFYLLLLPSPWLLDSPLICPLGLIVAEAAIYFCLREKTHAFVAETL
ncbi:hypothetical protein [Paludibacterium purpuratum]|uniref:O-antigen/teichoic acid export membrane protein n=1 Tax=Paludibacterium purpuratum TaxID=1144873 RepID=A0A4R7B267_9NEIS|nr:hypothetical protein [Paludibacterium purpuratum]TDR77819.1 hypothetical protein DFP86_10959 [Paludibacterium purpuratum]